MKVRCSGITKIELYESFYGHLDQVENDFFGSERLLQYYPQTKYQLDQPTSAFFVALKQI